MGPKSSKKLSELIIELRTAYDDASRAEERLKEIPSKIEEAKIRLAETRKELPSAKKVAVEYRRRYLTLQKRLDKVMGGAGIIFMTSWSTVVADAKRLPILSLPTRALNLSTRATKCLDAEGWHFVGDVIQHTEAELLKSWSLGRKSVDEIKVAIALRGLVLGMKVENWPPPDLERPIR